MSSSQRSRGQRGANRNSEDGEMKAIYHSIQSQINAFVQTFNDGSKNVLDIRDEEKRVADKKDAGGRL
jgi:SAGA-associated factor 29